MQGANIWLASRNGRLFARRERHFPPVQVRRSCCRLCGSSLLRLRWELPAGGGSIRICVMAPRVRVDAKTFFFFFTCVNAAVGLLLRVVAAALQLLQSPLFPSADIEATPPLFNGSCRVQQTWSSVLQGQTDQW